MAEKNEKNPETKMEKMSEVELRQMLAKQYGHRADREIAIAVYVCLDWSIDSEELLRSGLMDDIKYAKSFDHIDAIVRLYNFMKDSYDRSLYEDFVKTEYGVIRDSKIIDGIRETLSSDIKPDYIKKALSQFKGDDVLKMFRFMRKLFREDYSADELVTALLQTTSLAVVQAALELYLRGAMVEEISSCMVRFKYDTSLQLSTLKKEIAKRRLMATVRNEFKFM